MDYGLPSTGLSYGATPWFVRVGVWINGGVGNPALWSKPTKDSSPGESRHCTARWIDLTSGGGWSGDALHRAKAVSGRLGGPLDTATLSRPVDHGEDAEPTRARTQKVTTTSRTASG